MLFGLEPARRKQFFLVCAGYFLFSCSFNMPLPELPGYLTRMGGGAYIGWIIALFTLMAALSRPLSGRIADTIGRVPVMIFGAVVCIICSILYPFVGTIAGFLLLRFFHGLSTGFLPTGTASYVADIAPFRHRGEAMSTLGLSASLGFSVGPAMGSFVTNHFGMDPMFYLSSFMAFLAVGMLSKVRESLPARKKIRVQKLRIHPRAVIEKDAFPPSLVALFLYAAYGASLTLIPAVSLNAGLENKGIFFTFFTVGSVAIRLLGRKVPDRLGRIPTLKIAAVIMFSSMVLIALSRMGGLLLFAATLYGISVGLMAPAVAAWTVDVSEEQRRGRALATMYIAMEIGIGGGALCSGWLFRMADRDPSGTFFVMGLLSLLAFCYLQFSLPKRRGR